jgi:flagellar hook-associated protein 1
MSNGLLGISISGLNAAQVGIRTTQHNIANVNTPGYRRQEVDLISLTSDLSKSEGLGLGVIAGNIRSVYSQFHDNQVLQNQAQLSRYESYSSQATFIDNLASNPNSGLTGAMSNFFDAAQTVSSDPTSNVAREAMLSAGRNLSSRFNSMATAFNDMRVDTNREVSVTVTQINAFASQIAQANTNIMRIESESGQPTNDLRNQRDQAVADLNKLINVTPVQQGDGIFSVFVGSGQSLVVGANVTRMESRGDLDNPQFDVPALVLENGERLTMKSSMIGGGKLGGLLESREKVLMPAMKDLDTLAIRMANEFNDQHRQGFDKAGVEGIDFFTDLNGLDPFVSAARMMSMNINMNDSNLIAASSTSEGSPGDNTNALALAGLRSRTSTDPDTGIVSDTFFGDYTKLVSRTSIFAAEADVGVSAFETMTRVSTQARQSISGVNLDEEAANLIRYQQAYQASAKAMEISSSLFMDLLSILK